MNTAEPGTDTLTESGIKKMVYPLGFFLLFTGIIIAIVALALVFGTPSRWLLHAFTAGLGLVLLVLVIVTGMMMARRIRSMHIPHVRLVHTCLSIVFAGMTVSTFILGLVYITEHGEPLLHTPHGFVGLVLSVLCAAQVLLSLVVSRRQSIRTVHRITGYLIVVFFLLQLFMGLEAAGLFEILGN